MIRRAALIAFGVACLLVLGLLWAGLPTAFPPRPATGGQALRVAVTNLAFDNDQSAAVTDVLARVDPDVLVALEWTGSNLDLPALTQGGRRVAIDDRWRGPHGVLVLLRDTLDARAELVPSPVVGPCGMPFATVRLRAREGWISVVGVHAPPQIEECAETNGPTLEYVADLVDHGILRESFGAARAGDPLILLGDFNATPGSPELAGLRRGLVDAQASQSWVPTGTWTSVDLPLSFERIDYVMVADQIPLRGAWTVAIPGSDHRAVVVDTGSNAAPR